MSDSPPKSDPNRAKETPQPSTQPAGGALRELDARALLAGAREIVLRLDGEPYRLRITARDKLILTK